MELLQGGKVDYLDTACAGAVILIGRGMIVLVRPLNGRNEWLLPKGHQKAGESLIEAAIREAKEETGATCSLELDAEPLRTTSHIDHTNKENKVTSWFLLRAAALKTESAEVLADRASTKREIGIFPTVVAMAKLTYEEHRDVLAVALGGKE